MSAAWWALKPHGTRAAYRRHLRHGERPCQPCLQAERRAWNERADDANEKRRESYRRLRDAGATHREASRGKRYAA